MPVHVKTKKLVLAAMMTALAAAFMIFSEFVPTMRLAFAALACLCTTIVVAETGPAYALIAYAAASALSLLLAPTLGWLYLGLFGWYPSAKCFIERIKSKFLQWIFKLLAFNAAAAVLYFLIDGLFDALFPRLAAYAVLVFAVGSAAFVVFDLVLTKFIAYYAAVLRPKIINR